MINKHFRDKKRLRELKIENLIFQKFIVAFNTIIIFINITLTNIILKNIENIKSKTFKLNKMRFYKNQNEDKYIR